MSGLRHITEVNGRLFQGVECGGQRLLIKFPDHPITNGNDHGTITLRKNQSNTTKR